MNLSSDWKAVCGDTESLAIWTGSTFGHCFATVAFSFPSHAIAIIVASYYLGVRPKRTLSTLPASLEATRLRFPVKSSYFLQLILALLTVFPLVKLMVVAFSNRANLDSFVEDAMLMFMFCCWVLHLTYFRRIQSSMYVFLPGILPTAACSAFILILQFPVILSFDENIPSAITSMDFVFLITYQILILLAIIGYVMVTCSAKRNVYRIYAFVDDIDDNVSQSRPLIQSSSRSSYQSIHSVDSRTPVVRAKNIFARLFFWDAFPLLKHGHKYGLSSTESLIPLPLGLSTSNLLSRFTKTRGNAMSFPAEELTNTCLHGSSYLDTQTCQVSLLKILMKCFGLRFFLIGILRFLSDSLAFSAPFLLGQLTTFVSDSTESLSYGGALAASLFATSFFAAITNAWFTYLIQCITMQVRAALIAATFAKTLCTPHSILTAEFNTGQILTFLSTDTDRTANMLPSFHSLWSLPFQIGVAFYLLYAQLGLYFLAGVFLAILMIPINFVICRKIMKLTQEMLAAKDDRVKMCSEMLQGIKAVKLYAWEYIFKEKIANTRAIELWRCLRGRKLLDAFCVYFWATTPLLMQLSTFIAFIFLSGQSLTSARVYTSIALFNMLIAPLNAFPWVVNGVIDGIVSLRRLENFFHLVQFRVDSSSGRDLALVARSKYFCTTNHSANDAVLSIATPAVFSFPVHGSVTSTACPPAAFQLRLDFDISIPPGSLVCVIGALGTGKSSFLLSLIGELWRESGSVYVSNAFGSGIGFAPQQPWLISGSIRSNILFGRPFNAVRYDRVVEATALKLDFSQMISGDCTEVGEEGSALSGGQKQRVGIARAIYDANHSTYLLDDPFASVDLKVGRHILNHCVLRLLIEEQGATVVIATTRLDLASRADFVISLNENGVVEGFGKPKDVLGDRYSHSEMSHSETSVQSVVENSNSETPSESAAAPEETQEESQVGSVKLQIWRSYCKAAGYGWVVLAIITLLLMQGSRNAADIWLAHWLGSVEQKNTTNTTNVASNSTDFYITVYGVIGGANSLFALFRAFSFAYVGLYAAAFLHESLLSVVLKAPLGFFESTPIGRILNRFTADVWACDDSVPFELNILLAQCAGLIGTLGTIIYAAPITLTVVAPLAIVYFFLQRFYRFSSRDLKRLQMTSQSPIFSSIAHVLSGNGLPVVRSLALENYVLVKSMQLVDTNQRVQFSSLLASQWLSTSLQLMGVLTVGACCAAAILQHWRGSADPALVGLSLSYALSLTGFLSGLIGAFTESERQMISVERVKQYIDGLPSESQEQNENAKDDNNRHRDSNTSLNNGNTPAVAFNNVWLRYRHSGPYALCGISLKINQGERVAICGRTGAGKSSLFSALFRLVAIERGSIDVDGIDALSLSRQQLRSRLASIPQEPIVFSGSIRFNLDPSNTIDDTALLKALELAQLSGLAHRLVPDNLISFLNADVGERGAKLSLGERQLLCVARALASSTAVILCADEPTAFSDSDTEAKVIKALCSGAAAVVRSDSLAESSNRRRALLMIAHRLNNVLVEGAFDRIIVVDSGVVVEHGSPQELLANPESALSRLINAPGQGSSIDG